MSIKKLAKVFKALGNERRILILNYLLEKRELNVNQISQLIRLSFKSVSKHLSILENANLVKSKQLGLNKLYSLDYENLEKFIILLKNFLKKTKRKIK
jgi:ArsR family transcriptional regulator